MRYLCSHCGERFGEGTNKPQNGFCAGCWKWYLATTELGMRRIMNEWKNLKRQQAQEELRQWQGRS